MFTDEELQIIRWMANLIKAQSLSDRNAASRLSIAYQDRAFVGRNLTDAQLKMAKCDRILSVLNSEALDK